MLITLGTTRAPATDLGFLLHKHPDRAQEFALSVGTAHVLYPEADEQRCTVALLLEVDPVGLVRRTKDTPALAHYVNDRPYAASSLLSVALREVFRTAMSGRCAARPELAAEALPLQVEVAALPCRGGAELARALFAPLGWEVEAVPVPLDPAIPAWGDSHYVQLRLTGRLRLADALNQLYVLLPVLDGAKHYRVSQDEVDKLLRAGTRWLVDHPERELITRRYLVHRRSLTRDALARLADLDDSPEPDEDDQPDVASPLREQRAGAIVAVLRASGAKRVADLGCGEGALVARLLADQRFTEITAVDVSARALEIASQRLQPDRMPEAQRDRLRIFQSSLVYADDRLKGLDAAVLSEVVEHLDPSRLPALERVVFGVAAPAMVVVTTPNAEHNVRYGLDGFRHRDHRFEWTRAQFRFWARRVADRHGYRVRFLPVGPDDPEVGASTQMAVFERGRS